MLTLRLKSGEYLTIGDDIAIQIFRQAGDSVEVAVKAPREVPVLRGEVLERSGKRPQGLRESAKRPAPSSKSGRRPPAQERQEAVKQAVSLVEQLEAGGLCPREDLARLRDLLVRLGEELG